MKSCKQLAVLSLALLLLLCQGCGTGEAIPTDNAYHSETDYQDWGKTGTDYFAETPEGISYDGLERLYLLSRNAGMPQLCCSRPECRHTWGEEGCSAKLDNLASNGIQYMNGQLYYLENNMETNGQSLYRMDGNGDNRKLLWENLPHVDAFVCHRGQIYLYYAEHPTERTSILKLGRLNPKKTEAEPEVIWQKEINENSSHLGRFISAHGNYLIFMDVNSQDGGDCLYSMDLQSGEVYTCHFQKEALPQKFTIVGERVCVWVLAGEEYQLGSFSLKFEEEKYFQEYTRPFDPEYKANIQIAGDQKYLYWWENRWDGASEEPLRILDAELQLVDTVDITAFRGSMDVYISPGDEGTVFLNRREMNWGFYYFDKKDIGSGQIQLKGLPLVCATNDYTEPTDMPADFSWSN